jgi:myo-inositol 2-dehydrogenase/D-chiro-inositol 1-dehydrogenase
MTVNFAILGAGSIGQVHARAVAGTPNARLVAIADPMSAAAELVRAAYGSDIRTIETIERSGDVDAVVICTPNRHPCRPDRTVCPRRQGRVLRKAC